MAGTIKKRALILINSILSIAHIELIRQGKSFKDFISLRKTLSGAEKAGLSVGDYIDNSFNLPGATQLTIDKMAELGVFNQKIERVCEIGPGSGRYIEKTKILCHPEYYEIYETAIDWRNWLVNRYHVTAYEADGTSLAQTPTSSIDLVHSHKVFTGLGFLTILKYFDEMARVTRERGKVVFDIVTEECFDQNVIRDWLSAEVDWANCMIPKQLAINFFNDRGFSLVNNFLIPMKPGITQYFVFNKDLT